MQIVEIRCVVRAESVLFVALSGQFVALGGQLDKVVTEYRSYIRLWTDYDPPIA